MTEQIRNGGDLVVESLKSLGVETVFGIPGQHALGLFDALSRSTLRVVPSRVENNAAFAADGYARVTGRPAALFLSTGPGALTALAGLQEAYATSVPMIVVASQVPTRGLGGSRRGMLHQLDEQRRAATDVTKSARTVTHHSGIGPTLQQAWREAMSHPRGPVWVEIPQDVLLAQTSLPVVELDGTLPPDQPVDPALITAAAQLLAGAERPAIIAGGGVRRSGAHQELLAVAERLDAPVVSTPGGNGAFPVDHPLSLGSWVEDRCVTDLLAQADVLLAVGTSLGEVTSNYFTLEPAGQLIQVDAQARVLESNHPALGIAADARVALSAVLSELPGAGASGGSGAARAQVAREQILARLDSQDRDHERGFMAALREAIPDQVPIFWDMTIAGYWAWNCWDSGKLGLHSGQGAGGIGFAYPAALGGAVGLQESTGSVARVVAVSGDGCAMYGLSELATAVQHRLPVTWIIIDDGGYGILREYMNGAFGQATHTELSRPDFVAVAEAFGVPATLISGDDVAQRLRDVVREATAEHASGPQVIVINTQLRMFDAS